MKTVEIPLCCFALVTLLIVNGCVTKDAASAQNNAAANSDGSIRIVSTKYGKTYVKDKGWEIPGLAASEKKKTSTWNIEDNGKKVNVDVTEYDPLAADVVTKEPVNLLDPNFGSVLIYGISEFAAKNQKFCYRVVANRMGINEQTGARSYSGSVFAFKYYDEDGDGKFETLIFDEVDSRGRTFPDLSPHIPEWVLKEY